VIQRGRDELTDSASYSSKLWRQLSATGSAMASRKLRRRGRAQSRIRRRGSQPCRRLREPEPYIRGRLLEVEHSPRESQQRQPANPSPSRRGERSRVRARDWGSSASDHARRKWGNLGPEEKEAVTRRLVSLFFPSLSGAKSVTVRHAGGGGRRGQAGRGGREYIGICFFRLFFYLTNYLSMFHCISICVCFPRGICVCFLQEHFFNRNL
jgi:hypothetical protein